jgi:hypothetical protein
MAADARALYQGDQRPPASQFYPQTLDREPPRLCGNILHHLG